MNQLILRTNSVEEPLTDFEQVRRKISTEGEYSLSFLITRTERNAKLFDQIENKAKIILDNEIYIIDDYERDTEGTTVMKQVDAKHEMFDRLKAVTVKQEYTAQKQLSAWLDIVMAGSGLTYEISGSFPSEQFDNFGMNNGLELFKDLISRFGVEYRPYGTTIFIAKTIGEVTEAQFRHAHNLKTFSDAFNTDDVVTRVIAYGKVDEDTGKPLVSVTVESSNINAYDRVYEHVFQDERFTDKAALTEYAKTFLSDGKYSAKLEYEELIKNAVKLHNFGVGDYVYVIYELAGMEIDLQARVMSLEDDPFDQMFSPVLEVGSFVPDVTKRIRDQLKTGERVTRLEGSVTVVSQRVTKASEDASKAIEDTRQYSQTLTAHVNNTLKHVSDDDRLRWDAAAEEIGTKKTLKILSIGNSFSDDLQYWSEDIAASLGVNIVYGNMFISGGSLQEHWEHASGNISDYVYIKNTSLDGVVSTNRRDNTSLSYAITNEDWDLITFQQASQYSGMYETYQPYLNNLRGYVAARVTNSNVKYGIHLTWAYATDSTHTGFANYGNDQMTMYKAICSAVQQAMIDTGINIIIPSGTVIQNARSNAILKESIENDLTRDGYHLDWEQSRYMVAIGFLEVVSKEFHKTSIVEKVTYLPEGVSNYEGFMAKVSVKSALLNPFRVTEI